MLIATCESGDRLNCLKILGAGDDLEACEKLS